VNIRKNEVFYIVTGCLFLLLIGTMVFQDVFFRIVWWLAVSLASFYYIRKFMNDLNLENIDLIRQTNMHAETSVKEVLETMPLGAIRYNRETLELIWMNPYADYVFTVQNESLDKEKIEEILNLKENEKNFMKLGEKLYYFYLHQSEGLIYFVDVTNEQTMRKEIVNRQMVIGTISVDNYDDVSELMDEKQKAVLNSMITTAISDWMDELKVYTLRMNRERFYFVTRYKVLENMKAKRFDILDTFKQKMKENNINLTLSIGVSYGLGNSKDIGRIANNNLDMALVRGGDQVVIKEDNETSKTEYFGGNSNNKEKRTRVRTRAMATAIKGLITESEEVYIMGHRFPDMDAIGASFGMSFLSKMFNKNTKIVLDESQFIIDVRRCMSEIEKYSVLIDSVVTPEEALKNKKENSILIMVDYNNPNLSISMEVYEAFDKVIIIDHHRRSENFPSNPLISYIESSASSASELIGELIQFIPSKKETLSKIEATLLMAGIVVDTKSFQTSTTTRTFETAAFLRNRGADNMKVQSLLSSDLQSYMEMNELIANNEKLFNNMIISIGKEDKVFDSVTTSKAADTILSLNDVEASFVITRRDDHLIGISARSKKKLNVQRIMEEMGGGGHFNNAAAQFENMSIAELKEKLIETIQLINKEEETKDESNIS
jgi:c-di-AMP phosphodiesterase-like protein